MPKTITIRKEVYAELIKLKKEDESFSELFERLMNLTRPIDVLAKLKGSVEFKNKRKIVSEIYAKRAEVRI